MTEQEKTKTTELGSLPRFLADLKQPARTPLDYLISYLKIDSMSDETSGTWPSSPGQLDMGRQLVRDFKEIGIDASLDENGYVMAKLESNLPEREGLVKLGLIAHVDTSPDMSGKDVSPRLLRYEGGSIVLNEAEGIVMDPETFPNLLPHIGEDLLVTDGTTLLGADDKAGVAAIVALAAFLQANPELPHGELRFGFTPDEEIGLGAHRFDVERFDADYAYTLDGGERGELEYENFNAAGAVVRIKGRNVHPGSAKNKMINASHLARRFAAALPEREVPEHTEDREGFNHLMAWNSTVEEATLSYIIRDFDDENFLARKALMQQIAEEINADYGMELVRVELNDQYYNMLTKIEPYPFLIELAREAMLAAGVEPKETMVRGGTDGSQLSYKGLPCPNLFVGGENFHGRYEFLNVNTFHQAIEMLVHLVALYGDKEV